MDSMDQGGIKWGADIAVDGVRPSFVGDEDMIATPWGVIDGRVKWEHCKAKWRNFTKLRHIRLPANHAYYQKQSPSKIDWSRPIEAVCGDTVVRCRAAIYNNEYVVYIGEDVGHTHVSSDGRTHLVAGQWVIQVLPWTIRNVQTPEPEPAIDPALVERMVALVKRLADSSPAYLSGPLSREARDILKALEPVDPEQELAVELITRWTEDPYYTATDAIREGIRRGRQLERGEK